MNRNIHLRRDLARAAAVLVMAGVAAGTATTATAHAETKRCQQTMDHVDWALSNYEGAINSGNQSEIRFWQSVSRSAIGDMDAACG